MKIITPKGVPPKEKTSVALGLFDGLHLGHREVIRSALLGEANGLLPAVFTFKSATLTTKGKPEIILSDELKEDILSTLGVKVYCAPDFSLMKGLSPEEFIEEILLKTMNAKKVVCGEDFRFGQNAAGDVNFLKEKCKALGIETEIVPPFKICGETVSSTQIREFIRKGDLKEVYRYSGRPFLLSLPVIEGNKLGRTMCFPTINQLPPKEQLLPPFGVYASAVYLDGKWRKSMTNIGVKPTVGGQASPLAETNIFEFSGDLYGKTVPVALYGFIREEKKFSGFKELSEQLSKDVYSVKEFFEKGSIKLWKNE